MKVNHMLASFFLPITLLLTACGADRSDSSTNYSKPEPDFQYSELITEIVNGDAHTFIFELKNGLDANSENEIRKKANHIARDVARQYSHSVYVVSIYFFESGSNLPDLSRPPRGHFELTDFLYDGDHDGWNYIYMRPLIGDVSWVNCVKYPENNLCK